MNRIWIILFSYFLLSSYRALLGSCFMWGYLVKNIATSIRYLTDRLSANMLIVSVPTVLISRIYLLIFSCFLFLHPTNELCIRKETQVQVVYFLHSYIAVFIAQQIDRYRRYLMLLFQLNCIVCKKYNNVACILIGTYQHMYMYLLQFTGAKTRRLKILLN